MERLVVRGLSCYLAHDAAIAQGHADQVFPASKPSRGDAVPVPHRSTQPDHYPDPPNGRGQGQDQINAMVPHRIVPGAQDEFQLARPMVQP